MTGRAALGLLLSLVGCGGDSGGPGPSPTPTPVVTAVAVTPADASVLIGGTKQFTATVSGTGTFDASVSWAVERVVGGNTQVGTITAAGLYVTPFPAPTSVTIAAASNADGSKSASVTLSIAPPPAAQGPTWRWTPPRPVTRSARSSTA